MFKMEMLKDCPFCPGGGNPYVHAIGNEHTKKRGAEVGCKQCRFKKEIGVIRYSVEWAVTKAIEVWNTRASLLDPETLDKHGTIDALKAIQREYMRAAEPYQKRLVAFMESEPPTPIQGPDGQFYRYTGPLPPAPEVKANQPGDGE